MMEPSLAQYERFSRRWIFLAVVLAIVSTASGQVDSPSEYCFGEGIFGGQEGDLISTDIGNVGGYFRVDSLSRDGGKWVTDYVLDSTRAFGWKVHDRVGVFSPLKSLYFTAQVTGFEIGCWEIDRSFFVRAHFKSEVELGEDSVWSDEALIIWKPDGELAPSAQQFDPKTFKGLHRLNRPASVPFGVDPYDQGQRIWAAQDQLNDSMRSAGHETVPPLYNVNSEGYLPADAKGRFNYQQVFAPFVTKESYGFHDVIVLTSSGSSVTAYNRLQIAAVLTNREELSNLIDTTITLSYRFRRESFIMHGVVDLDFDGIYELVLTEYETEGSTYGSTTYVLTFKNGKPERIGPVQTAGGC